MLTRTLRWITFCSVILLLSSLCTFTDATRNGPIAAGTNNVPFAANTQTIELIPVDVSEVPEEFRIPTHTQQLQQQQQQQPLYKTAAEKNAARETQSKRLRAQHSIPTINVDDVVFEDASVVGRPANELSSVQQKKRPLNSVASASLLLDDPDFQVLQDGVSILKEVESPHYGYYKFTAPAANWPYSIHIMVTPQYGDPDLFVRLPTSTDDSFPNSTSYTWYSNLPAGYSESVLIRPNDVRSCQANTTTCVYYISVEAWSNTSYSILVRTGFETTELSNGIPLEWQFAPADNYTYYMFHNLFPNTNRTIAFSVTASYGEPEIYVDDVVQTPTSENSRWRETAPGSNVVGLTECNSEYYYIGVKGSHNRFTSYTILVHSYDIHNPQETATSLNLNYGLTDTLVFETFRYYYFHFVPQHDAPYLSVLVARHAGETDLYVNYFNDRAKVNSHYPNDTSYQYASAGAQGDHLINIYDPQEGYYYIGVKAKTRNSLYTIVLSAASDNTSNLNLVDGVHFPGAVSYGHYNYYQFRVYYVYDWMELAILVTARSGEGYMFLSDFDMHPQQSNATSYNSSTYVWSQSEFVLSTAKGNLHGGLYYVSVYGAYTNNFTYTITAHYSSPLNMYFGYAYSDYLSEESEQFYTLTIPYKNENATDVIITTNSVYGYLRLYGSIYPDVSTTNYYFTSQLASSLVQTIRIDRSYCTNKRANETCTIYLQTLATSDTSYSIMSYVAGTFTEITNNNAVSSTVEEGHYAFYYFEVEFDDTNVDITATPSNNGDVSLYVSRWSYVDADNYWYSSVHDGNAVEKVNISNADGGYYYVAVYGAATSSFSLKYTRTDPIPEDVEDGKPLYHYLPQGSHHFYKFVAPSQGYPYPLEFSIRPDFGDPDLYVHLQRNSSDKTLPLERDSRSYDWYSINPVSQVETVVIYPTSNPSCFANTTNCTYFISVHGYTYTSYYLTARTGLTGTELMNGVSTPERDIARNQYDYYFFHNDYKNQSRTIAFALTAIFGEPTIYIDDVIESPTSNNSRWRETAPGSNVVGLTDCDSEFYYIGVKASDFVFNTYSLVVHSYDPVYPQYSSTPLTLNQPIGDILVFNTWRYYHFYLSYVTAQAPPELAILVSKRVGEPFLYVSYSATFSYDHYPNASYYNWKSTDDGSNIVSIADPQRGYYFIGVRAEGHNTQYQIAAAAQLTNSSSLTLYDGTLYPGFVRQGFYNYYQFRVSGTPTDNNELSFVVTPLHGRCGIYVSDTVTLPNRTSFNWSSSTATNEVVVLSKGNGRLHGGMYYMSVYGSTNCSYSVMASYTSRYTFPIGVGLTGYLREEDEQFLLLMVPFTNGTIRDFTITLSTNFGAAYLYVSRDHDPNRGEYDWDWASYTPGTSTQTVFIPGSVCNNVPTNTTCNFYILVFAASETNYLLNAFFSNEARLISAGQTVTGSISRDQYDFYRVYVPNDRMNVTITVTPTSGNPDLYLSRYSQVSADSYDLKSETNSVERIYFDWTTPDIQYENGVKGYWYIAVYAKTSCAYSMVVTVGNNTVGIVTLSNGQPISDDVIPGEIRNYVFTLSKTNWPYDVSVSMNRIVGYASMSVITPDNTTINADEHGTVIIDPSYSHACNPTSQNTCMYRVRIVGYQWSVDCRYLLTYSTGHLPAVLVSGIASNPVRAEYDSYDYYMIANPSKGDDIILALNVLEGNPIMYVSVTEMYPSASNKNWSSTSSSRVIGLTNQQYSIYYVAVHAESSGNRSVAASYSLLGRALDPTHPENSPTYLSDGYPVISAINANVYDYFVFYVYPDDGGDTIDGFTVSITPKVGGTPTIYMDAITDFSVTTWPTKTKYTYTSHPASGNIVITVPKTDVPNDFTEYRIGVLSSTNSEYSITVMENGGFTYIGDGYEITNYLASRQYHYYYYSIYTILPNTSWSVSLTSTTGNAQLFVSDAVRRPIVSDSKSYNWSSTENGVNVVRLTSTSGNIHRGYYYIGVYCASTSECDYNIIVNYQSVLALTDGTAYESRLGTGGTRHLTFQVKGVSGQGSADINLWELVLSTPVGRGQLFVGTNTNKFPEYDDSSSYQYSSKTDSTVQRILFSESTCDNNRTCVYYIQIYCPTSCFYQIQAASASAASQLVPGTPAQGLVSAYGVYSKIYRFNIPNNQENVTLTLQMDPSTSLSNWPHMYVGLNNPTPTEGASDFQTSDNRRVQTIYFDYTSPEIVKRDGKMQGNCFVAIFYNTDLGNHETIPFTLSLKLSEAVPQTLTPGQDASVNLKAGATYYFQFMISGASWPYTTSFALRVPSGAADMYVNSGLTLPSSTSYNWKVENVNNEGGIQSIVVTPTDNNACIPNDRGSATYCTYTISVVARSDASIRLNANYKAGDKPVDPPGDDDNSGGSGNGAIIAVAIIVPLVAIIGGIAIYYYCCRGRSCNWSSSSSKKDDFYGSHIEMNEAGTRNSKKSKFNRLLDDADSDYARGGDDGGSYRPPRL
jgi:hypothetical protein